jgi:hypothetical protein
VQVAQSSSTSCTRRSSKYQTWQGGKTKVARGGVGLPTSTPANQTEASVQLTMCGVGAKAAKVRFKAHIFRRALPRNSQRFAQCAHKTQFGSERPSTVQWRRTFQGPRARSTALLGLINGTPRRSRQSSRVKELVLRAPFQNFKLLLQPIQNNVGGGHRTRGTSNTWSTNTEHVEHRTCGAPNTWNTVYATCKRH